MQFFEFKVKKFKISNILIDNIYFNKLNLGSY